MPFKRFGLLGAEPQLRERYQSKDFGMDFVPLVGVSGAGRRHAASSLVALVVLGGDLAYGTFSRPSFGAGRRERVKPGTSTYVPPKWSTGPKYSVRATCRS
jgi:hypothetical protein